MIQGYAMSLGFKLALAGVGAAALLGGAVWVKHAYDSALRREGAMQVQMEYAIRQQQLSRRAEAARQEENTTLAQRARKAEREHLNARAMLSLWKEEQTDVELQAALNCRLPAPRYDELCKHLTCARTPMRVPPARRKLDTGSTASSTGG